MDLKQIFIFNLRRFRHERGISQFRLAELCDTAISYIGEIEIGRRFPSLKLIEKIGKALQVEPYRFFIDASGDSAEGLEETIGFLAKLPDKMKLNVINRISLPLD
ncbi:MAG: helix-turn-helix transcriptional regulator [Treponema sp.]|jgi:transcriptional regulator with XRE-family HTH domain|nr:helix-turn-helix transcriptional regulator [Treponema sp.]